METKRDTVKKVVGFLAKCGGSALTGVCGGTVIALCPLAAPIAVCEYIAVYGLAHKVADVARDGTDDFLDDVFDLCDDFKDLWNECKEEAESR